MIPVDWFVLRPKTVMYMIAAALVVVMLYSVRHPLPFFPGDFVFPRERGPGVCNAGFASNDSGRVA
jgi:hypothetical protein